MLNKKIIISIVIIILLQLADCIALGYFNATTINSVASWSIDIPQILIILISAMSILILLYIANKIRPTWPWPLILIICAGVSNLLDRIIYGGVVDYIDIKIFPVFNFSDALITFGAIWMICILILEIRNKKN